MGKRVVVIAVAVLIIALPSVVYSQPVTNSAVTDPFANAVEPESTAMYQGWQGTKNDSLFVFEIQIVIRFTGARFVPLSVSDMQIMVEAFREQYLGSIGFVQLTTYREFYPEPGAPEGLQQSQPACDLAYSVYGILNATSAEELMSNKTQFTTSWEAVSAPTFAYFQKWIGAIVEIGKWNEGPPSLMYATYDLQTFQGDFVLHPIIVMDTTFAVTLTNASAPLLDEQATALASAIKAAAPQYIISLVEVVGLNKTGTTGLVKTEITMYACKTDATVPTPQCEEQLLGAALGTIGDSAEVKKQLEAAGMKSVEVANITQRLPVPPANTTAPEEWVPWQLDRIDQRTLPLDGEFNATASGKGVNVYIISSGVRGDHVEFGYLDGTPGTRAQPFWAFNNSDPLEDCPKDAGRYYGRGSYAASLCCGTSTGVAKGATIQSVRFRPLCMSVPQDDLLTEAMDAVLANITQPAVVLIDTWWSLDRLSGGDEMQTRKDYIQRLDEFEARNITVIAAAGPGSQQDPCKNVIASHPGVISVGASDTNDQAAALGSFNSTCITIWAPGGGLGTGLIGALPTGVSDYVKPITRSVAAAAVVTGVAAQYLQFHPNATAKDLRKSLIKNATQGRVLGAGPTSPNLLLYTNNTQAPAEETGSSGLSTGAIVGIAVGSAAVLLLALLVAFLILRKRSRKEEEGLESGKSFDKLGMGASDPMTSMASWKIPKDDLEFCQHPDGSEWVLGEGRYGKVYKAVKGGVQVVAVKAMQDVEAHTRDVFIKEIDMMKFVSRDANVTQFYGACVQGDELMLVVEYMEGGDLRTALSTDKSGQFQWYKHGKEVMLDIVRGVAFLHANNVVHRDIKSKNILLGRDGRAKVADVGLAKLYEGSVNASESGFVGTFAWAAPEALLGGEASSKVDIFALGIVLWELVTLEMPLRGRMRGPLVPRECPEGVATAIKACIHKDPAQRPTARQLYQMLLECPSGPEHAPSLTSAGSIDVASDPAKSEDSEGAKNSHGSKGSRGSKASRTSSGQQVLSSMDKDGNSHLVSMSSHSSDDTSMVTIPFDKLQFVRNAKGEWKRLGSGAFGTVFEANLDGVLPIAVKEVHLGKDPVIHASFIREAGILWRYRHQNIVALSGVSQSEGKGYLLMELMEGGSLYKMLNAVSKTSKQRVFSFYNRGRQVVTDVAKGICYLHNLRVTHFDLKSGNVLLTKELTAKVSDVGLAKVMSCTHHSLSDEGSRGTFAYMAPELMAGQTCTASVDIYSFGILLWEVCTGIHPVRGRMQQLKVPEDCPQEVSDLFDQCVAENPAARPTAREVLVRLTQISEACSSRAMAAAAAAAAAPAGADAANGQAQKAPGAEVPGGGQAAAAAEAQQAGSGGKAAPAQGQEGGAGEAGAAGNAGGDVKVFKVYHNAPAVASPFVAMQGGPFQQSPFASSDP